MTPVPRPRRESVSRRFLVRCEPSGLEVSTIEGSTLMEAIGAVMLPLAHACGGMGACGFCRVVILAGREHISPPGEAESEVLRKIGAGENERLACYARVHGDVHLTTSYW